MNQFLKYYIFIIFLLSGYNGVAQCTGGSSIGTRVPCAASVNTITISPGNYFKMYVVKGLTYKIAGLALGTISLTNEDATVNLTSSLLGLDLGYGYTATYTGIVRIYNCGFLLSASISYSVVGGSNTEDNQLQSDANTWRAHFYDISSTSLPPVESNGFSRYIANKAEPEIFDENFEKLDGGNNDCMGFANRNVSIALNSFATRFRMTSTKAAGAYIADIQSDDGSRLNVDGMLYYTGWTGQNYANGLAAKQLFPLNGHSFLILDYYDNIENNRISFQNFKRVNNNIAAAQSIICLGNPISAIIGTDVKSDPATINNDNNFSISYQWYKSANGTTFNTISGATSKDYQPTENTSGTVYYRRNAIVSRINKGLTTATSVTDISNIVKLTFQRTAFTATAATACGGMNNGSITVTAIGGLPPYTYSKDSGNTYQTANVFTNLSNGSYQIMVKDANGCASVASVVAVPLFARPNGALTNTVICEGDPALIKFTATSGAAPFSLTINDQIYTNITSNMPFNITPVPTTTTTYNLTKITDNNNCVNQNP